MQEISMLLFFHKWVKFLNNSKKKNFDFRNFRKTAEISVLSINDIDTRPQAMLVILSKI